MASRAQSNPIGGGLEMDRRMLLRGGLGLALTPGAIWASLSSARADPALPVDPNLAMIAFACDQTIPTTDTPGARAVGVPDFVFLAVTHGLADAKGDEIPRLRAELDKMAGGDYMKRDPSARLAFLHRLDSAAFSKASPDMTSAWPTVKQLILMGYYTSDVGASQELRYELVPGRFDPDVPYKKGDRAYSSDWTGVSL